MHFRLWKIKQAQLLPLSVQNFVPDGHLLPFIVARMLLITGSACPSKACRLRMTVT